MMMHGPAHVKFTFGLCTATTLDCNNTH